MRDILFLTHRQIQSICMGNGAKSPVVCVGESPPSTFHICFAASSVSRCHNYVISGSYFERKCDKKLIATSQDHQIIRVRTVASIPCSRNFPHVRADRSQR